jgi:hypothetical protein
MATRSHIGIPVGSHGVESELSHISQSNLRDAVQYSFELAREVFPDIDIEYTLSTKMLPSKHGMDINFYAPVTKTGNVSGSCTGEALFTYKGKPLLLITRAFGENGVDSTIAKLYRRQYWYLKVHENFKYLSNITFITAKRESDLNNLIEISSDFVYPHDINEFNFGQNSVYISDDVHGERFYRDVIIKALNKAINVYEKTY